MSTNELKQAIKEDIERLKSIELDIMSSSDYYAENRRLLTQIFFRMYLVPVLAFCLSAVFHWKDVFYGWETFYILAVGLGGSFLVTGLICLFIQDSLNDYVIFHHQLQSHLKTGELLDSQIQRAGWLAYKIFVPVVVIPVLFLHPSSVVITEFVAFFVSATVTGILVEMEMKRIGISILFSLVKDFFGKSDKLNQLAK